VFLARGAHGLHMAKGEASAAPYLHISPTATTASGGTDVLLFALPPPGGLLFTWEIQGRPLQALIDSAPRRGFEGTFNEGRPWTAQWRGDLRVAEAGTYAFHVEAITSATLSIDNQVIVRSNGETQVSLSPGWHAIRIDYVDNDPFARLLVSWRPPGEAGFAPIPDELLRPALSLP
jgi:hypothetical protein